MPYIEKVRQKILESGGRSAERIALWEKVSAAYEQSGVEGVKAAIATALQERETTFKETVDKLQKML
jgi:hypothetical protein